MSKFRVWSQEDDAKVRECYANGWPVSELAEHLQTTGNAVIGRATRLHLKHNSDWGITNRTAWKTRRERYGACGRKPFEYPDAGA